MGLFHARIYIGALGTRPHLGGRILTWGRRVPASALPSWGSIPQLGNKRMYCICLSRHRALTSKCRRGDASPPGKDALLVGEDALLTRAYITRVHNIYLETFFVPCFIFITQYIDNQYFQEMKHWHSMFHFWFQCFSGVSPIGVWFLSHWGFKSLPLGFYFSPTEFFGKGYGK